METIITAAIAVQAVADLVIAAFFVGVGYFLFDILNRARRLSMRVQEEGEEILDEMDEAREDPRTSAVGAGAALAAEIIADLVADTRRRRKRG